MLAKRASLAELAGEQWDLIVIGGGITGAGVLLEAARQGRKALLLEQLQLLRAVCHIVSVVWVV